MSSQPYALNINKIASFNFKNVEQTHPYHHKIYMGNNYNLENGERIQQVRGHNENGAIHIR